MPANPVLYYALADEVLTLVADALAEVLPEELRHGRVTVLNGPPSLDVWPSCGEQLAAWWEATTPTLNFPDPYTRRTLCQEPDGMLTLVVQSLRCEPSIDVEGSAATLPTPAELDAAARLVYVDARVIWQALACWAVDTDRDVALIGQTPVPPGGGVAGVETRVLVAGEDLGGCCAEGPAWIDLPEGFLAGLLVDG